MKTANTTSISKLVSRFDSDLKKLIMQDLQAINRTKNQVIDKIAGTVSGKRLSAA